MTMSNKQSSNKIEKNLIKLQYHQPQDIFVEADKGRISQVIHNLLDNAIKFTNVGAISINAQIKKGDKNDDEQLIVSVIDTGSGIVPEIIPRLFAKFATKSEKGTGLGLGLYISKNIVEAHGSRIWAENNKDGEKGSAFYFSLPLSK